MHLANNALNMLWNGMGDKKPSEYMNDLSELIEKAPVIEELYCSETKAVYAKHVVLDDMKNKIMFDFNEEKNKNNMM